MTMNSGNCKIGAYSNSPALALPGMAGKLLNTFLPMKEYFQFELFIRILSCNKAANPPVWKGLISLCSLVPPLCSPEEGEGGRRKKRENTEGKKERKAGSWSCVFLTALCNYIRSYLKSPPYWTCSSVEKIIYEIRRFCLKQNLNVSLLLWPNLAKIYINIYLPALQLSWFWWNCQSCVQTITCVSLSDNQHLKAQKWISFLFA